MGQGDLPTYYRKTNGIIITDKPEDTLCNPHPFFVLCYGLVRKPLQNPDIKKNSTA